MLKVLSKIFGTQNDRELKRIRAIVEEINKFEPNISSLNDEELKAKTIEFKLTTDDLAFYGRNLVKKAEKGDFNVWVGGHSNATLKGTFSVTE